MANILSSSPYIVQIDGKSNLVAQTITELRLKKRRQIFTNIFLGNMLLNDICMQKPLKRKIEMCLKSTKWYSIMTKLVIILEKTGYWCYQPKHHLKKKLKQMTRSENELRKCLTREKSSLQLIFKNEMKRLKHALVQIQELPPGAESMYVGISNYMGQLELLVRALAHAINHDRLKYLSTVCLYLNTSEHVSIECIKNQKIKEVVTLENGKYLKLDTTDNQIQNFNILKNHENACAKIYEQIYFLDHIGWWYIDSSSSDEDILKWLSITKKKSPGFGTIRQNFWTRHSLSNFFFGARS